MQLQGEWGPAKYPLVPGHEIVGIVTEVGPKVTKFKVRGRSFHINQSPSIFLSFVFECGSACCHREIVGIVTEVGPVVTNGARPVLSYQTVVNLICIAIIGRSKRPVLLNLQITGSRSVVYCWKLHYKRAACYQPLS